MTKEEIRDHADNVLKKKNVNGDNIDQNELEKKKQLDKLKSDKIKQGLKNAISAQKTKKKKRKLKGKVTKSTKEGKSKTIKGGKVKGGKSGSSGGKGGDDGGDAPDPPDPKNFEPPKKPSLTINDELRQAVLKISKVPKVKREEFWRGLVSKAHYKKLFNELQYFRSVNED